MLGNRRRALEVAINSITAILEQYGRIKEAHTDGDYASWSNLTNILHNLKIVLRKEFQPSKFAKIVTTYN